KQEIPFEPAEGSVLAQTTMTPATSPLVIHCLAPLRTQRSPRRSAVVVIAAGSEPACGSERAKAPATYSPEVSRVTYFRFCSSVPAAQISSAHMLVTPIVTAAEASPRAIWERASESATAPASAPP